MKKILSDGTVAKIGLVVVVLDDKCGGNKTGTVTEIVNTVADLGDTSWEVECKAVNPAQDFTWTEGIASLRAATPQEITEYTNNQK
jgi:hypothetical protein